MTIAPIGGITFTLTAGGVPQIAIPPGVSGGYIVNPQSPTDQGFSSMAVPEDIFVDPVNAPGLVGNNTTSRIAPGQSFSVLPQSNKPLMFNATTTGHKVTVVYWF